MAFWNRKPEPRSATITQSSPDFMEIMGLGAVSASDVVVTTETALGVPAIWAAVNFLSGTLAGLPLNLFEVTGDERKKVTNTPLSRLLHDAVNDGLSSFEWRKGLFGAVLTGGRHCTFIERNGKGDIVNFWPLNPAWVVVKQSDGRRFYIYSEPGSAPKRYDASEIIDITFMMKSDGVQHRGPITTNRDVIALAIAATQFGSKFFQNGGVPPFAVTGAFQSGKSMGVAADDIGEAVRRAAKERRQALVLPTGLEIKSIGVDAEKSQLVELKRFSVEEIARIYSLPPTFLQDLTHGTMSNTEQQDLHFTKHSLKRWVESFEQELNLKLFGRGERKFFVEMNVDGLLRGDFKTRMEGYSTAIQTAQLTPNEARKIENREAIAGGDNLMIQGATVPLGSQPATLPATGAQKGFSNGS